MDSRLTRDDWIAHGAERLAQDGFLALKVDPLARQLGVSRGSFYWHFANLEELQGAVLARWRGSSTLQVIKRIEGQSDDRLITLMRAAFEASWELERAVRAWAAQASWVAQEVAEVDQLRVQFVEKLMIGEGLTRANAHSRALLLYWAALGQMMTPQLRLKRGALGKLAQVLLRP